MWLSERCALAIRRVAPAMLFAALVATFLLSAVPNPGRVQGADASVRPKPHGALLQGQLDSTPVNADVTVPARASMIRIPAPFFGASTETWSLPRYEVRTSVFERVLRLLHVPGDPPLTIRIGGDSADHSYWGLPKKTRLPHESFAITKAWFKKVKEIAQAVGLRFIIDINLVANSPKMAAQWAQAALSRLPSGSVVGFEIGNEPDLYFSAQWQEQLEENARVAPGLVSASVLAPSFGADDYAYEFKTYQQALAKVAPGVPLIGPAVAQPDLSPRWVNLLVAAERGYSGPGYLAAASAHRYPLSVCELPSSPLYPTVGRVLDELSTSGMAASAKGAIHVAHKAGIRLLLTEINSVTCGGKEGVSDTFATALWAPDAMFELIRAGADGADVHIRADAINGPFYLGRTRGLQPRPLLYGLITFIRTLGPDEAHSPSLERTKIAPSQGMGRAGKGQRAPCPHDQQGAPARATPSAPARLRGRRDRTLDRALAQFHDRGTARRSAPRYRRHLERNSEHTHGHARATGLRSHRARLQCGAADCTATPRRSACL